MTLLDIDTSHITGDQLRGIRLDTEREHINTGQGHQLTHPTQTQMSEHIGLPAGTWGRWERRGISGIGAAMVRMRLDEGVIFEPDVAVRAEEVRALVEFVRRHYELDTPCEAREQLARELGITRTAVGAWCRHGHRQYKASLLRYFIDLFGVECEEVGDASKRGQAPTTRHKAGPDIDHRPSGALEVDCRPITADELKRWRRELFVQWGGTDHQAHPTQRQCAEKMGIPKGTLGTWERRGLDSPGWCALVRLWFCGRIEQIETEPATPGQIRALANLVGGAHILAKELGVAHATINTWVQRGRAPTRGGAGPLLRWLFGELDLQPADHMDSASGRRAFEVREVRSIRRREQAGESVASIARGMDAPYHAVYGVAAGLTYQWVDAAGGAA